MRASHTPELDPASMGISKIYGNALTAACVVGTLALFAGSEAEKASAAKDQPPDCTSIRDDKDGRYVGLACSSEGDMFRRVGTIKYDDRPYGVFYIKADGTYRCGYGNDGVLPTMPYDKVPDEAEKYCENAQPKLEDRNAYFEDHNCKLIKGTDLDACDDGTFATKIAKRCKGVKRRVYANFTSLRQSIFNATGKRVDHPFNNVISENDDVESIHYRFQVKASGKIGKMIMKAAVVRTDDIDEGLGWGFLRARCAPLDDRDGGPAAD